MKTFTHVFPILAIICGIIAAGSPADAGALVYSGKRKQVNCGIIKLSEASLNTNNGGSQPLDTVAGLFYMLDNLVGMKPSGWVLENPFASTKKGTSTKYEKREAGYWLVDLDAARDLSRMHVLYLAAQGQVDLNDDDREKLRKFVDSGGVLWIDNSSTSPLLRFGPVNSPNSFFIPEFKFQTSGIGNDFPEVRHHPLLTTPYWLTEQDICMLGANAGKCSVWPGYEPGLGKITSTPEKFEYLFPVVNSSGFNTPPSVASNAYGSGRIVATANYVGAGCLLNYPYCLPSLKFAYNLLAMSSSWTNPRKDPRHSGGSIDTVGGTKLVKIWEHPFTASSSSENAPVVYKNVVFYSSGNTLYAMDLKPLEDLDNDGKTDDGQDDSASTDGQDVIWTKTCDGELSSPIVVTMQDPAKPRVGGSSVDAVIVASKTGSVYVLNAFPTDSSNHFSAETSSVLYSGSQSWQTGATFSRLYPPVFVNGWIYVAGNAASAGGGTSGIEGCHIYALNPFIQAFERGNNPEKWRWTFPPTSSNVIFTGSTLKSGLCFGYTSAQEGSALIGMLYFATDKISSNSVGNDMVVALPLHVRNDRLKLKKVQGYKAECRVSISPAKIGSISRVWVKNYDEADLKIKTSPAPVANAGIVPDQIIWGSIKIEAEGAALDAANNNGEIPGDAIICADYDLTYDFATQIPQFKSIKMPLDPNPNSTSSSFPITEVTATPALGPDSMLYICGSRAVSTTASTSPLTPGGSIYGYELNGTNQFNRWNYLLHAGVESTKIDGVSGDTLTTIPSSTSPAMVIPGVVMKKGDNDWKPLLNMQPNGSPAYANGKVFATVSGTGGGALLCFKANPDFVIRIVENVGYGPNGMPITKAKSLYDVTNNRKQAVSLWQPNVLDDNSLGFLTGAVPVPSSMIDYNKGTITFSDFSALKFKGAEGTFSPSLPVWVLLDAAEVPIDFSTWGPLNNFKTAQALSSLSVDLSGWNNLLWYYPIDDTIHSSPVVIGDTVYFQDDSGKVYAINAEPDEKNGGQIGDDQVIWTNDDGSDDGSKKRESSESNFSIAGSNGVLLIPRSDGLYAYANSMTLVADASRIVELDGASELSWATDSITWPSRIPQSSNAQPVTMTGSVNKPNRVRYISQGEMLVVNSGANQVCRIDKSAQVGSMLVMTTATTETNAVAKNKGYIRWMYDKFSDPMRLLRPGQSTTLSGPTDALLWEELETDGTTAFQYIHCLIADSGNHRIVDLVYKFKIEGNKRTLVANDEDVDPESGYCLPRLNWVSITDSTNQAYVYDSIQLVSNTDTGGYDIWAAVSNFRTGTGTAVTNGGLGGAIVAIRYRVPVDKNGMKVWDYAAAEAGKIVYGCDRMQFETIGLAPLASPRYFQVVDSGKTRYLYVCDNYGVYKATVGGSVPTVTQILWDTQYRALDHGINIDGEQPLDIPLRATSVYVLPNTNWLITNNFSTSDTSGTSKFSGEVFEYNPDKNEIEWCSPNISFKPVPPAVEVEPNEPFTWEQIMGNGQILNEPTCASRQF